MSNRTTNKRSFSYTPEIKLPSIGKIKMEWDLPGLFYKSPKDPQLEADVKVAEQLYIRFAKKYKNSNFTSSNSELLKSLGDYKKLHNTNLDKVFVYLFLLREKNARDTEAEQILNQLQQRVTRFSNETLFYELKIGTIPFRKQRALLKEPAFSEYRFLLEKIFEEATYTLTEPEERILSLKALTSRSLWIAGTEKLLNNAVVMVGKEELPLNGALLEMLDAKPKRRHAIWNAIVPKLKELGPVAENELTALILDKKISDELRGYKTPYAATVLSFDTTEESLKALTEAVTSRGYELSKRYYRLKAKLYQTKQIDFIDRNDYPARLPELSVDTAVVICRDAFHSFNQEYGRIFDEMLCNGHIDFHPHKGKGGGAFCIGSTNTPTMVMLNHAPDFGSLQTLAHEMGHAIHSYRSKKQGVLYDDHSTVTAETASTFFEAVVGDKLMSTLNNAQKVIYLDALISGRIDTMIMCIARYLAELEMHETIRKDGAMTWQTMSAVLAKHLKNYCGTAVNITADDGLSVIAKTHYRRNFYQFSYSFGVIASSIMFAKYKADPSYVDSVDTFLCAGEKDTVDNIFAEIGIDTTKSNVFLEGLALLEQDIENLEQLVASRTK